ncbi:unnamed protein product [Trifolium pratense]|uniref:Uncharacterized protein n=1 Tax=Trifolium pratense TaxID=57577 RepID=A0ACB0LGU6_TRIPR|nr:unnamed protein product [Trifolium pratense]
MDRDPRKGKTPQSPTRKGKAPQSSPLPDSRDADFHKQRRMKRDEKMARELQNAEYQNTFGCIIQNQIIPKAVLWFTGEADKWKSKRKVWITDVRKTQTR